jgi:hypothetical protein
VWDFKTGKVVATIDNSGMGDQRIYNAKADRFLGANSNFYRGPNMSIVSGAGKPAFRCRANRPYLLMYLSVMS